MICEQDVFQFISQDKKENLQASLRVAAFFACRLFSWKSWTFETNRIHGQL